MGGAAGGVGDEGRPREMYAPKEREVEDLWGNQVKTGINFSKYDSIPVKVLGENKPSPITDFRNSGLATVLLENIMRAQYTVPTPVQRHGLHIMAGRDLMASAQTGSGKQALKGTRGYSTTRFPSHYSYPTRKILLLERVGE